MHDSTSVGRTVEEAYALALAGRTEQSLGLLEDLVRDEGIGRDGEAIRSAVEITRARILLARGGPEDRSEAIQALSGIALGDGGFAWRAGLDLVRLARVEGRTPEAAVLLKRTVDAFRQTESSSGSEPRGIAALLSREVADLMSDENRAAAGETARACEAVPTGETGQAAPSGLSEAESRDGMMPDRSALLRLVDLGKRLAIETDPDQILRIVLHEAIELCGTDRGFLVLVRDNDYEFAFAENIDWSEVRQPSFEISRTLIKKVIAEGRPILLCLGEEDGSHASQSLAAIGARSVACVPIAHAGKILGVLYLDGRSPTHAFDGQTEHLIEMFAAQAAVALENANQHRAKTVALEAAEETIRRQRTEVERRVRYEGLIGASEAMQEVYKSLDLIAPTEMPVIVLGETGTGKELAARLVHSRGPRSEREFVAMNCAGLPETLFESELFGHERGAFTGAERTRPGLFEIAHRGTLFLDEVGDMHPRMQADLLRVLQSGEVRRIGGRHTIQVDVRVIAATHRNLEDLVRLGEFREDLYFRLNVLSMRLPPLRERTEDIPLLVTGLMIPLAIGEQPQSRISERAMRRLQSYRWPGNVRELENVLRRLSTLGVAVIEEKHLPAEIVAPGGWRGKPGTIRKAEDEAIRRAVEAAGGNKAEAARILGVGRKTLYDKLRRLGLHRP